MLQTYLKAECLKFRRSLFWRLIAWIPSSLILISGVFVYVGVGLSGFSGVMVCNWGMPVASLSVVFLCHLLNGKDKRHQYRTLYSLPVDLRKIFLSKVVLAGENLLIISLVLSFIMAISEYMSLGARSALPNMVFPILGFFFLWLSVLWQIPFCLFLDQKIGFVGSVVINLFASAFGGLFFYLTPVFWVFPYSWPGRFMVTLFGILTNGMPADKNSRLILSSGEGILLSAISLMALVVFTALFSYWQERQVSRK
ncbi:lantibiotic immunity ABC transporter MutE/EpiE family permease subunit [Luxibacter massiliensis]|uniref:lantibiotic immunity ABC transporter MutE/EpiE family permease subunit n=1 Tax=Luxibacter massiliensis TaxID=2219695 RepID=UPI000F069C58|nr:lantibiotic immunity ABC transporter MutE/EpiE family permease subunit [Luxibacter massiliensis]